MRFDFLGLNNSPSVCDFVFGEMALLYDLADCYCNLSLKINEGSLLDRIKSLGYSASFKYFHFATCEFNVNFDGKNRILFLEVWGVYKFGNNYYFGETGRLIRFLSFVISMGFHS